MHTRNNINHRSPCPVLPVPSIDTMKYSRTMRCPLPSPVSRVSAPWIVWIPVNHTMPECTRVDTNCDCGNINSVHSARRAHFLNLNIQKKNKFPFFVAFRKFINIVCADDVVFVGFQLSLWCFERMKFYSFVRCYYHQYSRGNRNCVGEHEQTMCATIASICHFVSRSCTMALPLAILMVVRFPSENSNKIHCLDVDSTARASCPPYWHAITSQQ